MSDLASAYQAYQVGDYSLAEKRISVACRKNPKSAQHFHLSAIVKKKLGKIDEAQVKIEQALGLSPSDPNIMYEKVQILQAANQPGAAAKMSGELLRVDPSHLNANIIAGDYHLHEDYPEKALKYFDQGLKYHSNHPTLLRGRIFALKDCQEISAAWEELEKLGSTEDMWFTKGQLFLESFDTVNAVRAFELALQHPPSFFEAARNLMQIAFMTGGLELVKQQFSELVKAHPGQPGLDILAANIFNEIGSPDLALPLLTNLTDKFGANVEAETVKAGIFIDLDQGQDALLAARQAARLDPGNGVAKMRLCQALLMCGEFQEALDLAKVSRSISPDQVSFWVAMEATALRALGRKADYSFIYDYGNCVKSYVFETPPGYLSLSEFLQVLKTTLLELHEWKQHPLFQSLRNGTQTTADLRHSKDPVIKAFFWSVDKAINEYVGEMPDDIEHPLYSRKAGTHRISGAWSVALRAGGFHVNHIHPKGWISSAFYVDVPKELASHTNREGWIQFGEPPFKVKDASAEHFLCPEPGKLVLFPSYMWHGTVPFQSDKLRLTLPFDVMPL